MTKLITKAMKKSGRYSELKNGQFNNHRNRLKSEIKAMNEKLGKPEFDLSWGEEHIENLIND